MSAQPPAPAATAEAVPDFTRESEMGFTHEELLKSLPAAVAPYQIERQSARVYQLRDGGRRVVVTLGAETRRRLAAISLPVTAVKLEFFGFNGEHFERFMRRYKRYLHKGGG